jgi:hypothetical protein
MNGYDLGNQSRGGDRSSCRRSTIALTGTEISEFFIVECALQHSLGPNNNLAADLAWRLNAFGPLPFNAAVYAHWIYGTH